MGVVYRARHAVMGQQVALKLLLSEALRSPQLLARFQLEARAMARLDHPAIVRIHDVGEHEGRPYLVMELVEGRSLQASLRQAGPWPAEPACDLIAALARAVHNAHQQGILHRDLKPENVLLEAGNRPRLTDFGLAKFQEQLGPTRTGQMLGTPSYMPPEQLDGKGAAIDARADVYGLGATLYAVLTGQPPFRGGSLVATIGQVLSEPVRPPSLLVPELDPELEQICLRCLEKDPAERLPDALSLAEALEDLGPASVVGASPPGRPARGLEISGLLVLGGVVMAGGAASVGWSGLLGGGSQPGQASAPLAESRPSPPAPPASSLPPASAGASPSPSTAAPAAPSVSPVPPQSPLGWRRLELANVLPDSQGLLACYLPQEEACLVLAAGQSEPLTLLWGQAGFRPAPGAPFPAPRSWAALAYHEQLEQVVVHGGTWKVNQKETPRDETWIWTSAVGWRAGPQQGPTARYNASMAYFPPTRQVVLFGGYQPSNTLGDTWSYGERGWRLLDEGQVGHSPPPRRSAALAYDPARQELVLFGGTFVPPGARWRDANTWPLLTDTWVWDGSEWSERRPLDHPPGRRAIGSLVFDPRRGQLVLFGGASVGYEGRLGDAWTWDGKNWHPLEQAQPQPEPRYRPAMFFDPRSQEIRLFGGLEDTTDQDSWFVSLSDAWAF